MASVIDLPNAPANAAVVPVVDPVVTQWVNDGMSMASIPEGYVYDVAKKTIRKAKRKSGKKGAKKATKAKFAIPGDGLVLSTMLDDNGGLKGFVVGQHAKLRTADFDDPLDYHRYNVWFNEQQLNNAKAELESMRTLGATKEERKANSEQQRILTMMRNKANAIKATGDPKAKERFAAELGNLLDLLG